MLIDAPEVRRATKVSALTTLLGLLDSVGEVSRQRSPKLGGAGKNAFI